MKSSLLFLLATPCLLAQVTFPPDLTISRLEVVQTVQDDAQSVPLIAGKATAARVFVRQLNRPEALISNVTVFLRAFRNNVELPQSPQRAVNPAITARPDPDRGNVQHSLTFIFPDNWTTAGSLELRAELRIPSGIVEFPTDNNNLTRTIEFIAPTVSDPRIAWLPICIDGGCFTGSPAYQSLIERFLPIPEASLRYDDVPVPPVTWSRALSDLPAHLRKWKFFLDDSPLRPHAVIGWLPAVTQTLDRGASVDGAAWIQEQPDAVSNQTQLAQFVVRSTGIPVSSGGCAANIGDPGFNPITARLIPATRQNFLALCDNAPQGAWISPTQSRQLLTSFKTPAIGEPSDYLLVSGSARGLDSAYRITSRIAGDTPAASSDACLRITTPDGDSDFCFALDETAAFSLKVPVRGVVSRLALRRAGAEIATLQSSSTPPIAAFANAASGESWSGQQTLRWSATDPANRPLSFTVLYSNDEGANWIPLAVDLTSTEYTLDTAFLLGPSIQFRLIASAGLDQALAGSGTVDLAQTPSLELNSDTLDFGNATSGQISERGLVVLNKGVGPLNVDTIEGVSAPFRIATPLPARIRSGAQRPLSMRYRPQVAGVDSADVLINANDPATPSTPLALRGASFDTPQPTGILTPTSLDFGTVPTGQTRELTAVIRNEGAANLSVTSLSTQNARFSVVSPSGIFTLAPGEERTIVCRFSPLADGPQAGALNVLTNDPTRPALRTELRGTGRLLTAPRIDLSTTSLDFGSVNIGQTRNLSVTARNGGAGPLTLISITSSSAFLVVSPATPINIAPGAEQIISLRFVPVVTGPITATLAIESNDPDRPRLTVALSGIGLTAAPSLTPRITTLIPASMTSGSPRFNLTVNGSNFNTTSVVQFNGSPRPTTFLSANQVRASIAPEDVATALTANISVVNSPPGGGTSNTLSITVNAAGPSGQITSIETGACPTVTAPITVTDRIGGPITSLNTGNIACTEDGVSVPCTVNLALPGGNGLSVVMVLHASAGISDPLKRRNDLLAQYQSAIAYINAANVADRIAITQMDNGVRLLTDFREAQNREALNDALLGLKDPLGVGTSLYDAIDDGLQRLAGQRGRRKAMIVFTGAENTYDTNGQRRDPTTLDGLFSRIQTSGVALYFLPLGDGFQNQNLLSLMNQLSLDSAGQVFADQSLLQTSVITRLAEALSNQHLLTFTSPNRDGLQHLLRVNFSVPGASFVGARGYAGCR